MLAWKWIRSRLVGIKAQITTTPTPPPKKKLLKTQSKTIDNKNGERSKTEELFPKLHRAVEDAILSGTPFLSWDLPFPPTVALSAVTSCLFCWRLDLLPMDSWLETGAGDGAGGGGNRYKEPVPWHQSGKLVSRLSLSSLSSLFSSILFSLLPCPRSTPK